MPPLSLQMGVQRAACRAFASPSVWPLLWTFKLVIYLLITSKFHPWITFIKCIPKVEYVLAHLSH